MASVTALVSGVRGVLARGYHAIRNLPDRTFHHRRHFNVRTRLSRARRPQRLLVVCHGNICRSPYLQAVLQRALPDISVASAGFFGSDRKVPEIAVALGAQRGLDLSQHRSRPITPKVGDADLVIVMETDQARQIARMYRVNRERIVIAGDLDPLFATGRTIQDPWNQSIEVFRSSFDRLDRCASTLASVLRPAD